MNSESESQTGNSGSEDNVTVKDSGKNHLISSQNGSSLSSYGSLNGGLDRPLSPTSKDFKLNRSVSSFKKSSATIKKVKHR